MSWTLERAEEHLLGLELFGMRFGLERMRRLLTALGSPQQDFKAVHVVGTNGKSSTTRFTAGILEEHGVPVGAYTSPHLTSFAERVEVDGLPLEADEFAAAVERAARASAKVERSAPADEHVTQFELLTAAAFSAFSEAGVEVAVVEAGLGGRWDATNVLDAGVVVLTNVGLEHTRWLGPTVKDIAGEKLAVVRPGATLVCGPVDEDVAALAAATRAKVVSVTEPASLPALPTFQRLNFAVATAAAEARLGSALDPGSLARAADEVLVPGRFHRVDDDPATILDGAHNPSGLAALAGALREQVGDRKLVAVMSVLDDKDAAAMLRELLPLCSCAVFTSSANPRALPPGTLASLAGQLGGPPSEVERDPRKALALAREIAGPGGMVVATGSIYLVADLLSPPGSRRASAL